MDLQAWQENFPQNEAIFARQRKWHGLNIYICNMYVSVTPEKMTFVRQTTIKTMWEREALYHILLYHHSQEECKIVGNLKQLFLMT